MTHHADDLDRELGALQRQVEGLVSPDTARAIRERTQSIRSNPESFMAADLAAVSRIAAEVEGDPIGFQLAGRRAFLASPPNPSDLRRIMEETRRLDQLLPGPGSAQSMDQVTPGLRCNFCHEVLTAELKSAIAPLLMSRPPRTTLACLECTELAYVTPVAEERLPALQRRGKRRRLRALLSKLLLVGAAVSALVLVWLATVGLTKA
jgi:hypothetical protein